MEFEYWWFLIFPLFFGLGWLAARVDIRHLLSESRSVPASYFKGLNFLLNEQPDKAIEAFLDAAKTGTETIDLQFALGGLFRRRGEVERAIRMHQSLLDRTDLAEEQRLAALYELAQDYLKAGLFDRAEELFGRLLETHYAKSAHDSLLEIYVREKDWHKAIETAHELEKISDQPYAKEIAQFYCELAAGESLHGNPDKARKYLEEALESNRKSVRANMMLGDLETAQGQHASAIQTWKKIEMQSPSHLSLVAERLLAGYGELGKDAEGLALLRGYLERYPSLDLLSVIYQKLMEGEGPDAAYRMVRDELRRNPTLLGLDKLLEAQLVEAPPERRQDMQLIKNLVHQHAQRLALYQCDNCGFKARQFYWHCPACGGWDTYPPRRSEECLTQK